MNTVEVKLNGSGKKRLIAFPDGSTMRVGTQRISPFLIFNTHWQSFDVGAQTLDAIKAKAAKYKHPEGLCILIVEDINPQA